jgi:hypothetical protein
MNIAFCFSGGVRNFEDTFSGIKTNLLDVYNPDIFVYGVENKNGREENLEKITKLYSPKNIIINSKEFYNDQNIKYIFRRNVSKMWYNIAKCDEMRREQEKKNNKKYDYVFRIRFDNFCTKTLEQANINLNELNDTSVMIPSMWNFVDVHPMAKSDIFAIGTSKSMTAYSCVYDNLDTYMNDPNMIKFDEELHAETLMGFHLEYAGIQVIPIENNPLQHDYPKETGLEFNDINISATYRKFNFD